MEVYNQPHYYEIAFSFINPKKQVDLFEKFIQKYSKIKVRRFLDIACGPSLQLREISKRGYEAIGLDLNTQMIKYLQDKTKEEGIKIETIRADMRNFKLKNKVDFAFIMMGSFNFRNNQDVLKHLDCVANSLNKGGLYLIENLDLKWHNLSFKPQTWTIKKDGIIVKTTYRLKLKNSITQECEDKIVLEVNDHGKKSRFIEKRNVKMIFPQEFLTLVKLNDKFEFLGWFERFNFKKLKDASDNIAILRKK